jgi:regulator of protease activity HflC (stomatin/prohibitin superfamily)
MIIPESYLAVQYQVSDAKKYLFNVQNQTATLKQVTESAERGVIGVSKGKYIKLLPPLTSTITVSVPLITDSMVSR